MPFVTLIEITDKSLGLDNPEPDEYKLRKASRGILRRGEKIALINITQFSEK